MKCPHCGSLDDKVIESRPIAEATAIRRRRECLTCGYRFTSYEHVEEKKLMVVKRDGRREPFDIGKLERGIVRSLEKRPVSTTTIEEMLREIEDTALMTGKSNHEIPAHELGDLVLKKLYHIDRVAYVRFASVYKMFDNVEAFMKEKEKLTHQ